jgi:hypothetical protein
MDFSDRELKVVLQALYRLRGEVSGVTQTEQNKRSTVEAVIGRIEGKVGPLSSEKTNFDREMEESLSVLKTGHARVKKARTEETEEPAAKKTAAKAKAPAEKKTAPKAKKDVAAKSAAKPTAAKTRKSK